MNRWHARLAELGMDGSEPGRASQCVLHDMQKVRSAVEPTFEHSEHFEQEAGPDPSTSTQGRANAGTVRGIAAQCPIIEPCGDDRRGGIPEISGQPLVLRDGRRLWRFLHGEDCNPEQAAALIHEAHSYGSVLVADGHELIIVEAQQGTLPLKTLRKLAHHARSVVSELLRQSRNRFPPDRDA